MPRATTPVNPVKVRRLLECIIPTVGSREETAKEDEIEKALEEALGLWKESLWCRVLSVYPFNKKVRQVFFATDDNHLLVVCMRYRSGQWIRALPQVPRQRR
ncbi:hypothetical protein HY415_02545 [Candidatus Kaiserbacteria bacterium]|nr:hypothetical protein [Candidatus Kaiserbacteria bacterium]